MKLLIFLFISPFVFSQLKTGPAPSVNALQMYTCQCFCKIESRWWTDYSLRYDAEYHKLDKAKLNHVITKLDSILIINDLDVTKPDSVVGPIGYPTFNVLSKICDSYMEPMRFDWYKDGWIIALIVSFDNYEIFIYQDPYLQVNLNKKD